MSWTPRQVDEHVRLVHDGAEAAGVPAPPPEALVQHVIITEDRHTAAAPLAEQLQTPITDVLNVPYLWIGTTTEITEQIHTAQRRWGISRWVVRSSALDALPPILDTLHAHKPS